MEDFCEGTIEMPMGMASTIAESVAAIRAFGKMSGRDRAGLVMRARETHSHEEMEKLVASLVQM